MPKVGITFGCFIPFHAGHQSMINQSRTENDLTITGVTGHDYDRGKDFLPFLRRVRLMQEICANQQDMYVAEIDDKKLGLTGTFSLDAWRIWCHELFANASLNPDDQNNEYTWYIGEDRYIEKIRQLYPSHRFVKLDRAIIPISGTALREDILNKQNKYTRYINPVFRAHLTHMGILKQE